jgi:hypothetical protein
VIHWIGFVVLGAAFACAEWSRLPHTSSILSGFIGLGALFYTLGYFLGSGATVREVAGFWLVTAAGFAGGFFRDRFKSTRPI